MSKNGQNGFVVQSGNASGPKATRFSQLVRPLLVALGLIFLILLLYDLAEQTWLAGLNRRSLRPWRIAKGLISVLVLAAGVGWMILKASPRLIALPAAGEDWDPRPPPTALEQIRLYAWWFICMRWIAIMLAGILITAGVWLFRWLPREVWWPLLFTVTGLGVINLLYMLCLYRHRGLSNILLVQAYLDVVILMLMLHFTGGVENPLATLLVFHVIIGGILLSRKHCYGIATFGSGLFALMAWGEWSGVLAHQELLLPLQVERGRQILHLSQYSLYVVGFVLMQAVVLYLAAYFVTTLTERMRGDELRLERLANRAMAGQQMLEQALGTTGTGLRVLHCNLEPCWANERWREWFESPPDGDSAATQFLNGKDSPARQCLREGAVQVTELTLEPQVSDSASTAPGAQQCVFQVTTAPLKNTAGQIQQIVELAENITQHKETQRRMVRAGQLAVLGQLAGQVAHEVNNPITIISGKARLLLSNESQEMTPQMARELVKIAESAERVGRIMNGLLSYARPARSERCRFNMGVPMRKALAMVEDQARRTGVLIQDTTPKVLPPVYGNSDELEQVFLNLFLNALDAMPKGGSLKISASLPQGERGDGLPIAIVVEDTGTGIAPEIQKRIFEAFFTTKHERRGTGLGLSICLGLVRSHGGNIAVETKLGQGTRFILTMPQDNRSELLEETDDA